MNFSKKNFKLVITLFSLITASLICLFVYFEYNWFDKIAENEYKKTYNSIGLNINRIVTREFDRINMFINWLNTYPDVDNDSPYGLSDFIAGVYDKYFIDEDQNIIKSIGYVDLNDENSLEFIYDGSSWQSKKLSSQTLEHLDMFTTTQSTFYDNENLYITIFVNETTYIFVNLDLKIFSNNVLIPAITEANSELEVIWINQSNDEKVNQKNKDAIDELILYNFNPIQSLIEGAKISNTTLVIPIVRQQISEENDEQKAFSKDNTFLKPPIISESINNIEIKDIYAYLGVKVNNSKFYGTYIEKILSSIFIGGIILISLIGVICLLLLYQIIRVQRQRDKEREFTASITHELRTPLTVIQSASDNLCENLIKPEKVPSYGKLIKQQSTRLNSMIENLLVYSKIEGNKFYNKIETKVNLISFFQMMELQTKAISLEKNTPINWVFKNLEKEVLIDRRLLELVISNLISNSLFHAYNKYSGEIRIYIQFIDHNHTIHCIIEDDGVGIPLKEQKLIWNSYFRGENSRHSQERGSGLGLFIIKKNIAILGGNIKLTSPYKRLDGKIKSGCHFEFSIPCKVVKNEENINNRR
ncbi:MAG: HAMP domain-containing sensor histidine kinase [Sphaerochaetaceae bacterium]|nr:HAMP domain-containing sensor histidine kinase [Sphaerochaetaceae bacterium]